MARLSTTSLDSVTEEPNSPMTSSCEREAATTPTHMTFEEAESLLLSPPTSVDGTTFTMTPLATSSPLPSHADLVSIAIDPAVKMRKMTEETEEDEFFDASDDFDFEEMERQLEGEEKAHENCATS